MNEKTAETWDCVVPVKSLIFQPASDELFKVKSTHPSAHNIFKEGCQVTPWALRRISAWFGIAPWVLWRRLPPEQGASVLTCIAQGEHDNSVLVRGVDHVVRAFLSEQYIPVDLSHAMTFSDGPSLFVTSNYGERFYALYETSSSDEHVRSGVLVSGSETGVAYPEILPAVIAETVFGNAVFTFPAQAMTISKQELTDRDSHLKICFDYAKEKGAVVLDITQQARSQLNIGSLESFLTHKLGRSWDRRDFRFISKAWHKAAYANKPREDCSAFDVASAVTLAGNCLDDTLPRSRWASKTLDLMSLASQVLLPSS